MNPSLTRSGKLVMASGLGFVLVGIILSDPFVVLLGQVHFVLLVFSVIALIPGALVLDRRHVSLRVTADGEGRAGSGQVVGATEPLSLHVKNASGVNLHHFEAVPFAPNGIRVSHPTGIVAVGADAEVSREFKVTGLRSGRWVLQGFDICIHDPFGLVETRDYLPVVHAFEVYPFAGWLRRRKRPRKAEAVGAMVGLNVVNQVGSGSEIRELRDWHSGDSLKDIAWKPSVRARRLVSRDYDKEETATHYVMLDVSSSMRGGQQRGDVLEHAIHTAVELVDDVLERGDRVGFMTFDEKLYGHVLPGGTDRQMQRILHHIVGIGSIVDADMTELDDEDSVRLLADYALVQERLDFRKGDQVDPQTGVNPRLMARWLASVLPVNREQLASPALKEGVLERSLTPVREFLQLRGVDVPYRVEARLGMKERGLVQGLEQIGQIRPRVQHITVVSDLAGVMNAEPILRAIRALPARSPRVSFLVPFGPAFYGPAPQGDERLEIVRGLFTSAEADERRRVMEKLRSGGVEVTILRPNRRKLAKGPVVD